MPTRWRKRPVVIEAFHWDGSRTAIDIAIRWVNACATESDPFLTYTINTFDGVLDAQIWTLEGPLRVSPGDWIIKGVKGEFYPCKPDIFDATYESVPWN